MSGGNHERDTVQMPETNFSSEVLADTGTGTDTDTEFQRVQTSMTTAEGTTALSITDISVPEERTYRDGRMPELNGRVFLNGGHVDPLIGLGLIHDKDVIKIVEEEDGIEQHMSAVVISVSELVNRYRQRTHEQIPNPGEDPLSLVMHSLEQQIRQISLFDYNEAIRKLEFTIERSTKKREKQRAERILQELTASRDLNGLQVRSMQQLIDQLVPEGTTDLPLVAPQIRQQLAAAEASLSDNHVVTTNS